MNSTGLGNVPSEKSACLSVTFAAKLSYGIPQIPSSGTDLGCQSKREKVPLLPEAYLCGVSVFSLWLCWFFPSIPVLPEVQRHTN